MIVKAWDLAKGQRQGEDKFFFLGLRTRLGVDRRVFTIRFSVWKNPAQGRVQSHYWDVLREVKHGVNYDPTRSYSKIWYLKILWRFKVFSCAFIFSLRCISLASTRRAYLTIQGEYAFQIRFDFVPRAPSLVKRIQSSTNINNAWNSRWPMRGKRFARVTVTVLGRILLWIRMKFKNLTWLQVSRRCSASLPGNGIPSFNVPIGKGVLYRVQ